MSKEYDIVVVGSGIAGLSAGLTSARLGRSTLVLTGDTLGGHLISIERVDGYPGFPEGVPGFDLCPIVQEQAMEAGAEVQMVPATRVARDGDGFTIETPSGAYAARAVIAATGTRFRELGVEGEAMLEGKGVSQCASCDAPLLRQQAAVVAGGGDSALQEALTLAEHCSKVTIVHHGEALTGQAAYRRAVEASAVIELRSDAEITQIDGGEAVTGVRIRHRSSGEETAIECTGVFVFVGLTPVTDYLDGLEVLAADGGIETDVRMQTSVPGLFAAGTVRAGSAGRAAAAAGEGALAAVAADRHLSGGS